MPIHFDRAARFGRFARIVDQIDEQRLKQIRLDHKDRILR